MQPTNVANPDYYHRVVDCQWACPAHTNVPEYIRLIAQGRFTEAYLRQPRVERVPRHPGPHLRPALRAGVPPRPGRRQAGGDLPAEAGRGGPPRRGQAPAAATAPPVKNGKRVALDRRRAGVADGRQRPDAARLRSHDLREAAAPRRTDADQHPGFPAARAGARRGDRLHPRHGRRRPLQHAGRQPRGAARRPAATRRCSSAAARRRARSSTSPAGTTPIRSSSASTGSNRFISATSTSVGERVLIIGVGNTAMDCCRSAKRLGATDVKVIARKTRKLLQGLGLGARGRRGRGRRDPREPPAGPLRRRERQADRDGVRPVPLGARPAAGLKQEVVGREILPCDSDGAGDRPGQRVSVHRAQHRPRVRQVGHAGRRQDRRSCRPGPGCSSAATRPSARPTSSGRSSTGIRRRSRSTTTARGCR